MGTKKPISTISYNKEEFLKEHLESLYNQHIIQSYMYIKHKGEDGDKDHIHLRIEPNKIIDPMDLQQLLKEYDPKKPDKPLMCRPFRPSKEEDWILYAVHDKEYLRLKYGGGEKGEKIPYKWEDVVTPDDYDMEIAFIRAKQKLEHTPSNLIKQLSDGTCRPEDLIYNGENVYVVNAINKAIYDNKYFNVVNELSSVKQQLQALTDAVYDMDYTIECGENGKVILKKFTKQDKINV